jgi:hypothetical protein
MDFRPYVDRLFRDAPDRLKPTRQNPVTGACWVRGVDRPGPQKRASRRALVAREVFAWKNPGMPPLPLSYAEREKLKENGGPDYIESVYARSLKAQKYDSTVHPGFPLYARGVMASPFTPDFIKHDPAILKDYPPRPLGGLGPGLYWSPAKPSRPQSEDQSKPRMAEIGNI